MYTAMTPAKKNNLHVAIGYSDLYAKSFYCTVLYCARSMCSLAVSTQDSPAVEPRSNPGAGKILMSENLRLYTTSPVVMC